MDYTTEGLVRFKKSNQCLIGWRHYYDWQLFVNQGWRNAILVATVGASFLFEYEMPNGQYYFYEVRLDDNGRFSSVLGKSINKRRLPVYYEAAEWFVDYEIRNG